MGDAAQAGVGPMLRAWLDGPSESRELTSGITAMSRPSERIELTGC
jgi:hypothetical protein